MPAPAEGLTPQAQQVLATFDSGTRSRRHLATLRRVIASSAHLTSQINDAVASGRLQRLEQLPAGTNSGGQYLPQTATIQLPVIRLTRSQEPELAFTLGHEIQHALNAPAVDQAVRDFFHATYASARSTHDYTEAVERLVDAHRTDEGRANLAGWNALVDNRRTHNPTVTLRDVVRSNPYRTADFVADRPDGSWGVHPNLRLNADLSVELSDRNVAGMGHNFFDKPADEVGLGPHGESDYTNYYTGWAIGEAAQLHTAVNPGQPMLLDMARLNASRRTMERNGISLGPDAGQPPVRYLDVSTRPPTSAAFHHTVTTHRHIPLNGTSPGQQDQLAAGASPAVADRARRSFGRPPQQIVGTGAGRSSRTRPANKTRPRTSTSRPAHDQQKSGRFG